MINENHDEKLQTNSHEIFLLHSYMTINIELLHEFKWPGNAVK